MHVSTAALAGVQLGSTVTQINLIHWRQQVCVGSNLELGWQPRIQKPWLVYDQAARRQSATSFVAAVWSGSESRLSTAESRREKLKIQIKYLIRFFNEL